MSILHLLLKNVVIPNYNGCKLLKFIQKVEKPLSTRVCTCPEANVCIYIKPI